jgi:hypothetical protein
MPSQIRLVTLRQKLIKFLTRVEEKMNSSVLGSEERPIIWKCPFDANKKQVGTICLDNVHTWRVLKALMELVDIGLDVWYSIPRHARPSQERRGAQC